MLKFCRGLITRGLVDESRGPGQTESVLQWKHLYKVGGGEGPELLCAGAVLGPLLSRLPLRAMYPSYVDVTQPKYHDHTADHLYFCATSTLLPATNNYWRHLAKLILQLQTRNVLMFARIPPPPTIPSLFLPTYKLPVVRSEHVRSFFFI